MNERRLWRWEGLDEQGASCHGLVWASERSAVTRQLHERQIWLVRLKRLTVSRNQWGLRYKIHFIRQLATLLQAGNAPPQALSMLP